MKNTILVRYRFLRYRKLLPPTGKFNNRLVFGICNGLATNRWERHFPMPENQISLQNTTTNLPKYFFNNYKTCRSVSSDILTFHYKKNEE